jgi:hypothetical protein
MPATPKNVTPHENIESAAKEFSLKGKLSFRSALV